MSNKTVYLISGSNRGIGYTLAATLAVRPNTIVFAGARDPAAQSLKDLAAKHPNVHPIKLTSGDEADNAAAAAEIQKTAGHLDVVIANAGIAKYFGALATTPLSEFTDHWQVNTFATVVLYQAVHKLLLASPTGSPKFAYISTIAASLGAFVNLSAGAYASSKAAANYLVKALDVENPGLVTLAISPGWVATDMGNKGAVANGMPQAPVSVEDSVAGILARVDAATKETSGRFWNYSIETGGKPWELASDEIAW
ncbi:aflatoxin biosynthesis ketoreductase-like protein nor-1 [Mycena albidolilacea]|uniref:Aflatoxin biosynthesis ketoreductase-like protein nor-1 n=1 Tax=Mycena albidolilacea TaxID=1033008 RepID=A0AAD6ZEM9_9AGAR|nr:aflatoxin biosynthesis ketoreductase-like protein nor-1 [Mycena albidolilacea]